MQKKFQKQFGVRQKWDQKSQKPRDSSVEVRSDWEVKEEMDFPQLMKMRYLEVSEPQDIECCGALEYYDKAFDRITTRSEKPLRSIKRIFHTVTTTDDPVIRKVCTLCPLLGMLLEPQKEQGMRCTGVPSVFTGFDSGQPHGYQKPWVLQYR